MGHNQENTSLANLIKHLTIGLSSLTSCDWEIDKIQFQSLESSQLFVVKIQWRDNEGTIKGMSGNDACCKL